MLPLHEAIPALRRALSDDGCAVLQAPPGAGKTTVVPLELLAEPWLAGRKIVMLEPRRLAARAAARRMAGSVGQAVGRSVGHRVRFDTRVSRETRLEVVTEGVLTRMRQDDPSLEGIGLLIFDEFHERSIHADLGLALALESREALRPDLRILVMSATLDGERVAALLGGAPVITSTGRLFEVETRYRPRRADQRLEAAVAAVVREALNETESDVLVFLPGAGEIHRVAGLLQSDCQTVRLFALHGTLPVDQQDAAIAPSPPGSRKVVLATSIAETSLTIEGVRVVVDAGLMRVPRFSPRTGMSRLETIRVSRASADQRRGRAGRVAPGICYRLWDAHEEHGLVPFNTPEILATDLAPLALDLAAAGVRDPRSLKWLDPPPEAPFAQARALLVELGALSRESRVASREMGGGTTEHGRRMAELPIHPRLAHMLLQGARLGEAAMAAELAALLGDRDILRRADGPTGGRAELPVDIGLRLDALRGTRVPDAAMDRAGAARARQEASVWIRTLRPVSPSLSDASRPTHSRTASPAAATPPAGFSSSTAAARAFPSTIRSRWRNGSWHSSWMMWAPTAECGSRRRSTRTMWQQSRRNARRLMRKSGGTQRPRVSSPGVSPAWVRSHSRSGRSPIPTRRSCGSHCSRESGRAASRRCRGASQAWRCGRGWPFSISPIQRGPM